jgi:hypothetical protein
MDREDFRWRFYDLTACGPGDCIDWQGPTSTNRWGHVLGRVRWKGLPSTVAPRVAYWIIHGDPLPPEVRHTCDRPICVNPDHLIPGTHADNMRDMVERGRSRAKQTHCRTGHEYAVHGVRYATRGNGTRFRVCLECERLRTHVKRGPEKEHHRGPPRKQRWG